MKLTNPSPLESAQQRSWNYWFDDGLPMLVGGATILFVSLFLIFSRRKSPLSITAAIVAGLLYIAFLFGSRKIIEWLKTRITYPRTGYARAPYFTESNPGTPVDFVSLSLLPDFDFASFALASFATESRVTNLSEAEFMQ